MLFRSVLIAGVPEPDVRDPSTRPKLHWALVRGLSRTYWTVVIVGAVLTLARFSEAFLVLRAQVNGMPTTFIPLVMVVMSVAYTASAYPAGALSDRIGRVGLLAAGLVALIGADLVLAAADSTPVLMAGVILWGLHMGLSQGLLAAMVADHAPTERSGTAFGVFNLASGAALLLASWGAGFLWDTVGPAAIFVTGAAVSALALPLLVPLRAQLSTAP